MRPSLENGQHGELMRRRFSQIGFIQSTSGSSLRRRVNKHGRVKRRMEGRSLLPVSPTRHCSLNSVRDKKDQTMKYEEQTGTFDRLGGREPSRKAERHLRGRISVAITD